MNLSVNRISIPQNKPAFGRDGQKAQKRDIEERLDELEEKTEKYGRAIFLLNKRIDNAENNIESPDMARVVGVLA